MGYCYSCGDEFSEDELTRDHVPPRCFSDVYPDEYKKDRITVPCCGECNERYQEIDNELRDMMVIMLDKEANHDLLRKSIRSQLRKKYPKKGFVKHPETGMPGFKYDAQHMDVFFMKCHKGIYFHEVGEPLDHDFESIPSQEFYNPKHDTHALQALKVFHERRPDGDFIISGHPKIFRMSILGHGYNKRGEFKHSFDFSNCDIFTSYMVFLGMVDTLVLSIRKEYYKDIDKYLPDTSQFD